MAHRKQGTGATPVLGCLPGAAAHNPSGRDSRPSTQFGADFAKSAFTDVVVDARKSMCALPTCAKPGPKACECRRVRYCGKECELAEWRRQRKVCKQVWQGAGGGAESTELTQRCKDTWQPRPDHAHGNWGSAKGHALPWPPLPSASSSSATRRPRRSRCSVRSNGWLGSQERTARLRRGEWSGA